MPTDRHSRYIYIYIYTYIYVYIYIYVCVCLCLFVCFFLACMCLCLIHFAKHEEESNGHFQFVEVAKTRLEAYVLTCC